RRTDRSGDRQEGRGEVQVRPAVAGVQGSGEPAAAVVPRAAADEHGEHRRGERRGDGELRGAGLAAAGRVHDRLAVSVPGAVRQGREGRREADARRVAVAAGDGGGEAGREEIGAVYAGSVVARRAVNSR